MASNYCPPMPMPPPFMQPPPAPAFQATAAVENQTEDAFDYDSTLLRELKLPWFERKGRGRGKSRLDGRPLLPPGMWEFIYFGVDSKKTDTVLGVDDDTEGGGQRLAPASGSSNNKALSGAKRVSSNSKDMHDKSDWSCGICMNTNWHWRDSCNKCNTTRPIVFEGDGRLREGVGGGFNERQERASAAVVEVAEDGFDDFGRRKDKAKQDKAAKEKAALERLHASYGRILGGVSATNAAVAVPSSAESRSSNHPISNSINNKNNNNDSNSNYGSSNSYRNRIDGQFDDRNKQSGGHSNSGRQDNYKSGGGRRSRSRSRNRDRGKYKGDNSNSSSNKDLKYESRSGGRSRSRDRGGDRHSSTYRR